ncbi:hypothetical protein ARMSODRAFT_1008164 [Armillaria solidipes]|uniref:Fungal-type protein kinase domain-containing protein n=1 Tax=Armillaria solidipes TaxID=1076256 RepID=A0A2H3BFR0_9AGAR|nr:hypothetical protein ARMSODRAFT_1008164 [Armillaria solidipes]
MDTPPNEDTPTHVKLASLQPYSSVGGQFVEPAFVEAARELENKYVLVSSDRFLAEYLPQHPDLPNIDNETFMEVTHYKPGPEPPNSPWELRHREQCMYNPMITALRPFLKEGWEIIDTSNSPDPHSTFFMDYQVKPDLTVYSDKEPSNKNRCRVCDMETFIELKLASSADPFTDDAQKPEKDSADARDTRGQLVTYLNAMQAAQHRTHGFGVFIAHRTCRLLRHTHSGIVVTTGFDYTKSDHLQTFFWRLSHAVPAIRGTDTTFQLVPSCGAAKARVLLNAENETLWRVFVGERSFYVAAPFTRSHYYPVGRGTRCFVAVECNTQQKCLLKDAWRLDGYHREDEVYQRLHDKNAIRKHTHYRIMLDVVGEPLVDFESTHAMVQYVLNALEAHYDAVTQAGVEHHDISVGNIIIVRNSGSPPLGYLIDWELAKFSEDKGARACEKMGTRQFMSARLCRESPPPRTLGDDLESFALVLLWLAGRYAKNELSPITRCEFLLPFERKDGTHKAKMLRDNALAATLHLDSHNLEGLLADLLDGYRWRYFELLHRDQEQSNKSEELTCQRKQLETHDWLMTLLRDGLKDEAWKAVRDPSRKEQKVSAMVQRDGRKKRKSDCSEYERTYASKRLRGGEHGGIEVYNNKDHDEEDGGDYDKQVMEGSSHYTCSILDRLE